MGKSVSLFIQISYLYTVWINSFIFNEWKLYEIFQKIHIETKNKR